MNNNGKTDVGMILKIVFIIVMLSVVVSTFSQNMPVLVGGKPVLIGGSVLYWPGDAGGGGGWLDPMEGYKQAWWSGQNTNAVAILDDKASFVMTNIPNMATGPTRIDALYTNQNNETVDIWSYDGSDDCNLTDGNPLLTASNLFWRAWVRMKRIDSGAGGGINVVLGSAKATGGEERLFGWLDQNMLVFRLRDDATEWRTWATVSTGYLETNVWYLFTVQQSGTNKPQLALNGQPYTVGIIAEVGTQEMPPHHPLAIGRAGLYTGTYWARAYADIFDPAVYNATATVATVTNYFENTHPTNYLGGP